MLLFDFNQLWNDYRYYIVCGAILVVLLFAVIIACIAGSKRNHKAKVAENMSSHGPTFVEPTSTEPTTEQQPVVVASEEEEKTEEVEKVEEIPAEEDKAEEEPEVVEAAAQEEVQEKVEETEEVKATANGKYVIIPDGEGFRYVLKAANGEALVGSDPYTTVVGCKNAIRRLKDAVSDAEIRVVQDKNRNFQFHIVRGTRTLAHSSSYKSKTSAVNASKSFLKYVSSERVELAKETKGINTAELVDLTGAEVNTENLGKIVVYKENELFLFKLIANNGQVICTSTTYKTITTVKNAIKKFQDTVYSGKFYIAADKSNNYQFKLYNESNRLVLVGENFSTKEACLNNVQSCYRFAKNAEIEEQI